MAAVQNNQIDYNNRLTMNIVSESDKFFLKIGKYIFHHFEKCINLLSLFIYMAKK